MSEKKAKYTPRPWKIQVSDHDWIVVGRAEIYFRNYPDAAPVDRPEADAALIAAAPELFELGRAAAEFSRNRCRRCNKVFYTDAPCMTCDVLPIRKLSQLIDRLESEVME